MPTPPRCLLVTKEFSAVPTSGGMLRTLAIFEQLAGHFETTVISPDAIVTQGPDGVRRTTPAASVPAGAAGRAAQVATARRYRSISGVRIGGPALLANIAQGASGRYDVGIADHTCIAGLADDLAAGCDEVVVSMHNIESDLMDQRARAAASPAVRAPMTAETHLLRRIEARVAGRYPVVVCTEADARTLGGAPIVCRNGIFAATARPDGPAAARTPYSAVFSGALDWEPNNAGLVWFAEQVWPLVRAAEPRAQVTVAGRNPTPAVVAACDRPGITLLPNPPVMSTVLEAHQVGIVPLLNGGGSRIKILEYLAAGIDIVSTDIGAAGLEDVPDELIDRLPQDPARFAGALLARLASPGDTGPQAQDWVRKNYAWDVTLRPLLEHLTRA